MQGKDGDKLSVDEIINDLESDELSRFGYEQNGGPSWSRTRDLTLIRRAL